MRDRQTDRQRQRQRETLEHCVVYIRFHTENHICQKKDKKMDK